MCPGRPPLLFPPRSSRLYCLLSPPRQALLLPCGASDSGTSNHWLERKHPVSAEHAMVQCCVRRLIFLFLALPCPLPIPFASPFFFYVPFLCWRTYPIAMLVASFMLTVLAAVASGMMPKTPRAEYDPTRLTRATGGNGPRKTNSYCSACLLCAKARLSMHVCACTCDVCASFLWCANLRSKGSER